MPTPAARVNTIVHIVSPVFVSAGNLQLSVESYERLRCPLESLAFRVLGLPLCTRTRKSFWDAVDRLI